MEKCQCIGFKIIHGCVIVMSLVWKSAVHTYWARATLSHTPFFGKLFIMKQVPNHTLAFTLQWQSPLDVQVMIHLQG